MLPRHPVTYVVGFGLVHAFTGHLNTQHVTTLYKSPSHKVTFFTALLGNVFQQWIFLCSRDHVIAGWRPSHTNSNSSNCRPKTEHVLVLYSPGTDHTENVCSLVAGKTTCPQSCSLTGMLSPVYTAVTRQRVYMPKY
jgi:hypothetical protein